MSSDWSKAASVFRRTVDSVQSYAPYVAAAGFGVTLLLLVLGIVSDTSLLITLGSIVVLGFLFHMFSRVESLNSRVEEVLENMSARLRSLHECQDDMTSRLEQTRPGTRIEIDHLGLDMSTAWTNMERMLRKHLAGRELTIRLLMITSDEDAIRPLPQDIRSWCDLSDASLDKLKNGLQRFRPELARTNTTLHVEVRRYATRPVIHGFRVKTPFAVLYAALCKWQVDPEEYDWGGERYRLIEGTPSDTGVRDLVRVFDGEFEHLWRLGEESSWTFESA